MKHPRLILVFAFTLAAASLARADLFSVPPAEASVASATVQKASAAQADPFPAGINDGRQDDDLFWPSGSIPDGLLIAEAPQAGPKDSSTQSLPSAPGSATLCLSAFAGFGVWQLTRSARKMHLGSLPDWYHDGGPAQVGQATPIDLSFSLSSLVICHFEAPDSVNDRGLVPTWWLSRVPRHPFSSQFTLLTADPRGPPAFSLSD